MAVNCDFDAEDWNKKNKDKWYIEGQHYNS